MSNLGVKKRNKEEKKQLLDYYQKEKNKNLKKIKKIGKKIITVIEDEEDGKKMNMNEYSLENFIKTT